MDFYLFLKIWVKILTKNISKNVSGKYGTGMLTLGQKLLDQVTICNRCN